MSRKNNEKLQQYYHSIINFAHSIRIRNRLSKRASILIYGVLAIWSYITILSPIISFGYLKPGLKYVQILRTFGIEFANYQNHKALLMVHCGICIFGIVVMIWMIRAFFKGSRTLRQARRIFQFIIAIITLTSYVSVSIAARFFAFDFSSETLRPFSNDVKIWETHFDRFSTFIAAFCFLSTLGSSAISCFIFTDNHPRSNVFSAITNPFIPSLIFVLSLISVFLAEIINDELSLIFTLYSCIVAITELIIIFYMCPMYTLKSNSIISGYSGGKLFISILASIAWLINNIWVSTAIGIVTILFLPVAMYYTGLICYNMNQYTMNKLRNRYKHSASEPLGASISNQQEAIQNVSGISNFQYGPIIRLLSRTQQEADKDVILWFYKQISAADQKNLAAEVAFATFLIHFKGKSQFETAEEILEHNSDSNIFKNLGLRFQSFLRLREIKRLKKKESESQEMKHFIDQAKLHFYQTQHHISKFWEELSDQQPQNSELVRHISAIRKNSKNTEDLLRNLIDRYPDSAVLHKIWAMFLEDVKFDYQQADEVFGIASTLNDHNEEQELRNSRRNTSALQIAKDSSSGGMVVSESQHGNSKADLYRKLILTKYKMMKLRITVFFAAFSMIILVILTAQLGLTFIPEAGLFRSSIEKCNPPSNILYCLSGIPIISSLNNTSLFLNQEIKRYLQDINSITAATFQSIESSQFKWGGQEWDAWIGRSLEIAIPFLVNESVNLNRHNVSTIDAGNLFQSRLEYVLDDFETSIKNDSQFHFLLYNEKKVHQSLLNGCEANFDVESNLFQEGNIVLLVLFSLGLIDIILFILVFGFVFWRADRKKKSFLKHFKNLPCNLRTKIFKTVSSFKSSEEISEKDLDVIEAQDTISGFDVLRKTLLSFFILIILTMGVLAGILVIVQQSLNDNAKTAQLSYQFGKTSADFTRLYFLLNEYSTFKDGQELQWTTESQVKNEASLEIKALEIDWRSTKFGNESNDNANFIGYSDTTDRIILNSICANGFTIQNITKNVLCLSMDDIVAQFISESRRILSDENSSLVYLKSLSDSFFEGRDVLQNAIVRTVRDIEEREYIIINVMMALTIPLVLILYLLFLNPYLSLLIDDNFQVQSMLNMVPISVLESTPEIRRELPNSDDALISGSNTQSILSATRDGVLVLSKEAHIEEANHSVGKMFGYQETDIMGRHISLLIPKLSEEIMESIFQKMMKGNFHDSVQEVEGKRKDGNQFPAKISMNLSYSESMATPSVFIRDVSQEKEREEKFEKEKNKNDVLLHNLLPQAIAARVMNGEEFIADEYGDATCMFVTIEDFSDIEMRESSGTLMHILSSVINRFDELTDQYALEKIKTIGETYFVVGGLPEPSDDHPNRMVGLAMSMLKAIEQFNEEEQRSITIRIGICTGAVVAGVLGKVKLVFDLWGDTVNTASRMMSTGYSGRIQCTESTFERSNEKYEFEKRENVFVKGKGNMTTYLVDSQKTMTEVDGISLKCSQL